MSRLIHDLNQLIITQRKFNPGSKVKAMQRAKKSKKKKISMQFPKCPLEADSTSELITTEFN